MSMDETVGLKSIDAVEGLKRAIRRSKWSEAGVEDKTEILKQEIIYLRNSVSSLSAVLKKMEMHSHSTTGEILVPMNPPRNMYGGECDRMDPLQA